MKIDYDKSLLTILKTIKPVTQGAVGDIPHAWANQMGINHNYNLPKKSLTKTELINICNNEDVLFGYLCVMAWGAQGRGPSGPKYAQSCWASKEKMEFLIKSVKNNHLSRENAYNIFAKKENKIKGLGPSYFTKLLFFFSSNRKNYIMDQWTTKSVLLLTNINFIKHGNGYPNNKNDGVNYELFCRVIDDLAKVLNLDSGVEMEEQLFSFGSIKRKPRGEFRQIIYDKWNTHCLPRYNISLIKL